MAFPLTNECMRLCGELTEKTNYEKIANLDRNSLNPKNCRPTCTHDTVFCAVLLANTASPFCQAKDRNFIFAGLLQYYFFFPMNWFTPPFYSGILLILLFMAFYTHFDSVIHGILYAFCHFCLSLIFLVLSSRFFLILF